MSIQNTVFLIGRLVKDPELKFTTGSGVAVANFTLAVDRDFETNGKKEADFISIVCWRKLAELVANNLGKGRLVAVSGSISTRNFLGQDGKKVYITEVTASEVKFLDWPKDSDKVNVLGKDGDLNMPTNNDFFPVEDDDIPF